MKDIHLYGLLGFALGCLCWSWIERGAKYFRDRRAKRATKEAYAGTESKADPYIVHLLRVFKNRGSAK